MQPFAYFPAASLFLIAVFIVFISLFLNGKNQGYISWHVDC